MERQLWPVVLTLIDAVSQAPTNRRFTFSAADIARVYLWAVLHDRPTYWACQPENWPAELRPARLPVPSTLSRRLRRPALLELLESLQQRLRRRGARGLMHYVDGKPLSVRPHTRDPEARKGWAGGGYAKGYKLHLIGRSPAEVRAWEVTPMNASEPRTAARLVRQARIQGYLLGDANYDTNALHAACRQVGLQLVAPRRHGAGRGLGHRRHDPGRLRCIDMLENSLTGFGPQLHRQRPNIERQLGSYSSASYGIAVLPPWVRRLHRVKLWVGAKLIFLLVYHQRLRKAK